MISRTRPIDVMGSERIAHLGGKSKAAPEAWSLHDAWGAAVRPAPQGVRAYSVGAPCPTVITSQLVARKLTPGGLVIRTWPVPFACIVQSWFSTAL